jgi:hypothetical protein
MIVQRAWHRFKLVKNQRLVLEALLQRKHLYRHHAAIILQKYTRRWLAVQFVSKCAGNVREVSQTKARIGKGKETQSKESQTKSRKGEPKQEKRKQKQEKRKRKQGK